MLTPEKWSPCEHGSDSALHHARPSPSHAFGSQPYWVCWQASVLSDVHCAAQAHGGAGGGGDNCAVAPTVSKAIIAARLHARKLEPQRRFCKSRHASGRFMIAVDVYSSR